MNITYTDYLRTYIKVRLVDYMKTTHPVDSSVQSIQACRYICSRHLGSHSVHVDMDFGHTHLCLCDEGQKRYTLNVPNGGYTSS